MDDVTQTRSRPRPHARKTVIISIAVSPGERDLLVAAATAASMPRSCWIRLQALRTATGVSLPPEPFPPPAARHSRGKRRQSATAHFTDEQYEAIVDHARACGMSVGTLVRRLVLGCEPIAHRPVVRSAIAAVHRAGVILLQLLHRGDGGAALSPDQMRAVADLRAEIHALRDALLRADAAGAPDLAE